MNWPWRVLSVLLVSWVAAVAQPVQPTAPPPQPPAPYEPKVGQPGKDVVWVPTSPALVEKMLDMARVTPRDLVVDLGSGDGRNVIAAAKRGARALGVEYNPDMVALSKQNAAREGVSDKATFVEGDMFEADFSEATVLALFLLSNNLEKLRPKLLDLKPGTRIVANTFGIPGWNADETETIQENCTSWCTALLWIVPAKVAGTWQSTQEQITIEQSFQTISGTVSSGDRATPIERGALRGVQIRFDAGDAHYVGRVRGDRIEGTVESRGAERDWIATRVPK